MAPRIKWRTQYDDEQEERAGELSTTYFNDESLTQQQFTDEVNLNTIVSRFGIKDVPVVPISDEQLLDFSAEDMDLRTAMDRTHAAQEQFKGLPADLRARFNNDPRRLWKFVTEEKNHEEAVKLGLLKKREAKKPPEPMPVRVIPEASTSSSGSPTPSGGTAPVTPVRTPGTGS